MSGLVATALAGAMVLAAASSTARQTLRAADVASGIGVNVHLEYTDGGYADAGRVLEALTFVGVSLVRDAAPDPGNRGQGSYALLAGRGVRFDLFVNGGDIATAMTGLSKLETGYPGAVHAIEGPNEINNHASFGFAGITDKHRAATAYQAALYAAVKASPSLQSIPVLAFTDYPVTPGPCDVANFHAYPDRGAAPGARLAGDADEAQAVAPGKPLVDTEFGYATQPVRGDVSQRGQARLILAGLLDNALNGVRETYLYQLLDAYPDPGADDGQKHFGLFDIAARPKLAAQMLRRLTSLLQDTAPTAQSFPLGKSDVVIEGLPAGARTLRIEKANGGILVALWTERPVWDAGKQVDLEGSKADVVLKPATTFRSASVIDLVEGTTAATGPARSIRVHLGASPLFVRIDPA